jgi:hypothetical protein
MDRSAPKPTRPSPSGSSSSVPALVWSSPPVIQRANAPARILPAPPVQVLQPASRILPVPAPHASRPQAAQPQKNPAAPRTHAPQAPRTVPLPQAPPRPAVQPGGRPSPIAQPKMQAAPPIPAPRSPAAHVVQQKAAIAPPSTVPRQAPASTQTSRPPSTLQAKTARDAGRSGVIQRYNIGTIYNRYIKTVAEAVKPEEAILSDAQIVHDTLNNREKADIYFGFTDRWVQDRVKTMGVSPMRALASIVGGHVEGGGDSPTKLSKLFEVTAGEFPFLETANKLRNRPFHDVSAGLHHGEYEHSMQLHFVSDMYKYPNLYGTTGLRKSYQELIGAMLNSKHVIQTPEGDQLSFWSLVMDIQGGFIKGKKNKGKDGVRFLFEEEEDPYASTLGTSATLMHYGFGVGNKQVAFESSAIKHGELAHRYPHIAEAVHNRGLKRTSEATKERPFPHYKHTDFGPEPKLERRQQAQERVRSFKPPSYTPIEWEVRPQGIKDVGSVRKDVLR